LGGAGALVGTGPRSGFRLALTRRSLAGW